MLKRIDVFFLGLQTIGVALLRGQHCDWARCEVGIFGGLAEQSLVGVFGPVVVASSVFAAKALAQLQVRLGDPALDFPIIGGAGACGDAHEQVFERFGDGACFISLAVGGEGADLLLQLETQADVDIDEFLLGVASIADNRFEGRHHFIRGIAPRRFHGEISTQCCFVGLEHKAGAFRDGRIVVDEAQGTDRRVLEHGDRLCRLAVGKQELNIVEHSRRFGGRDLLSVPQRLEAGGEQLPRLLLQRQRRIVGACLAVATGAQVARPQGSADAEFGCGSAGGRQAVEQCFSVGQSVVTQGDIDQQIESCGCFGRLGPARREQLGDFCQLLGFEVGIVA